MKKNLLLLIALFVGTACFGQSEITEKGYFHSSQGFACKNGSLYTADMKTMIRRGYSTRDNFNDNEDKFVGSYWSLSQSCVIPEGCVIIPSNIIYQPTGTTMEGRNGSHSMGFDVYIPSSVRYIALDAFMSPFVRFFSYNSSSAAREIINDTQAQEIARYNLHGRKVSSPERGINIVQMSDKSVHKEVVK